MSFDPTGYTLAHEHLHIDLSALKTTWTAALISMRSFARR
ncbi:phosphotriesterase-like protein [Escherichia coli]|uniref:Phosphotriesterase-like protein n=1 Tax=Escherichia coli TaxID=562 RepID=A0A377K0P2_ECOLX|nr:phosphotriesterase-like protein [Escherichia coli]